ncbi:MAG: hypothetical protein AAGA20_13880 [Planctomycetota bacterium]
MRSPRGNLRTVALLVAALAAIATAFLQRPEPADVRAKSSPLQRLLGPIASAAASVEWARFARTLDRGDAPRAYGHAARALTFDGRSAAGWMTLGDHFIFTRASPLEVDDAAQRRRWIRAGLDVLLAGEERVAAAEELAYYAALIRVQFLAQIPDEALAWPGGSDALLEDAREDLSRAEAGGHPGVADLRTRIEERRGAEER